MKPLIHERRAWPLKPQQAELWMVFRAQWGQAGRETVESRCLCGFDRDRVLIADRDRYGLPLETFICRNCGLLYTTPRLTDEALQSFYEHEYRELYFNAKQPADRFFAGQSKNGEIAYRRIAPFLAGTGDHGLQTRATVIDFGCGAGGALVPFAKQGMSVIGFDYDEDYLSYGRARDLNLVNISEGGPAPYLLENNVQADVAMAQHVLEHCADPVSQLKLWTSCLKPGGLLYIEVPGVFHAYREYSSFAHFLHLAHLYHFTLSTLSNTVLTSTGFGLLDGDESIYAVFRLGANPVAAGQVERFLRQREGSVGRSLTGFERFLRRTGNSVGKRIAK